jgi:hypothetical protein
MHHRAAIQAPRANHERDSGKYRGNDRTGNGALFRGRDAPIAAPRRARSWPEQGRAPVVEAVAREHAIGTRFRARSAMPIVLPLAGDVNGFTSGLYTGRPPGNH